jgi:predicted dehydrogenase
MYNVGIVGIGNIAAFYATPEAETPYCHVGGIRLSDRVRLAAVSDLLEEKRQRFRDSWGAAFPDVSYYDSSTSMLAAEPFDIVAICNRGPDHCKTVLEVLEAGPRAIFLEKPPSCSLEEMDRMMAVATQRKIPVTVSYTRHWGPRVLRMQELIQDGLIGEVETVVAYTGGTFLSFAAHVTDLICQFAGYDPVAISAHGSPGTDAPEGYEPEPSTKGAVIEFGSGVSGIHVPHDGEHGGFYVDIFGSQGRARAGIYTTPFAIHKDKGPIDLEALGMPHQESPLRLAYDQIAAHLDGGPLPHCTNEAFTIVNELCYAGIESFFSGQRITLPNASRSRRIFANG